MEYNPEYLKWLRALRLFDDDFMKKCFEDDNESVQFILRLIMDMPTLVVTSSKTQYEIHNLQGRSVRFDVRATDSEGRLYDIEIQRSDYGAGSRRARHNSALLDANALEKGQDVEALPETYVIFITENDVLGGGQPVYHIERTIRENGQPFNDGAHILYVNGEYRGDDAIGWLMHDFACCNPADMHYKKLADKTKGLKETGEGEQPMCRLFEQIRDDARAEGRIEGVAEGLAVGVRRIARQMLTAGKLTLQEIAAYTGLTQEQLRELQTT